METYKDYFYHHGVKGMKWGRRKDKNLSFGDKRYAKKLNKASKLSNKYRTTQKNWKLAREGLYQKGPKSRNFANQLVGINRNIKQLDKYASHQENKVKKLLQKSDAKNLTVKYDVVTKTYSVEKKK